MSYKTLKESYRVPADLGSKYIPYIPSTAVLP